jgi:hypothetical protein
VRFHFRLIINFLPIIMFLSACSLAPGTNTQPGGATSSPVLSPTSSSLPPTPSVLPSLSITLGTLNQSDGILLAQGGDTDTKVVTAGSPAQEARSSGNGKSVPAPDGNTTPDSYLQFDVSDQQLNSGKPTSHVRLDVNYLDKGTDTFSLQYDALPSNGSSGLFAGGGAVVKTNTGVFKTASFNLCDANFANRDNGADFRISDNGDGAEIIHSVQVIGLPSGAATIKVDDFGANPKDDKPDSSAIQAALDSSCSGDTVVFTSGVNSSGYKGYRIDKTLFLTGMSAKHDLIFTSSDPGNHALLQATADLKGYVVRLFARSRFNNTGDVDNINFGYIDVSGDRAERVCLGPDHIINGKGDNWGSWLPECSVAGDPWCSPGNIGMDGAVDIADPAQNYQANPAKWTTGVVVHDLVDQQAECGSALAFGGAAGTIQNVTVDTAGDHVHAAGCAFTDQDGDVTGWSDGMTIFGTAHQIIGNTIVNPSDVGIVYFGGKNTLIANNTITIMPGNYGAFAGIALHPWEFGDVSGTQISGNHVTSQGDTRCGGLHAGINVGAQMWGGACVQTSTGAMIGNPSCSLEPAQPKGQACRGGTCQLWASIPVDGVLTLKDNVVSGAQINYFIEGVDILGQWIEQNNVSQTPRLTDWEAARTGCDGVTWGPLDKVAHAPALPGWVDLRIHCER